MLAGTFKATNNHLIKQPSVIADDEPSSKHMTPQRQRLRNPCFVSEGGSEGADSGAGVIREDRLDLLGEPGEVRFR